MIIQSSLEPIYNIIALLGLVFVIYMGGNNAISKFWDLGTFTAFLTTYMLVAIKASKVSKAINSYQKAKVSWNRCKPYLESVSSKKAITFDTQPSLLISNLSVWFDDKQIIKDFNLNISKPMILGICGRVHSGKSTLLSSIASLLDYDGKIEICGFDVKELDKVKHKNLISFGLSDMEIFNDSIENNITLGQHGNVIIPLKDACLYEEVNELKNKTKEYLTHTNPSLSGGQLKRLMIARCLFNQPKIILLDDPFNAIDQETSIKILNNLKRNYENSIFVISTNNKEILNMMDKVIYFGSNSFFGSLSDFINDEKNMKIAESEL